MNILIFICVFLLGTIIGSFLNVVIYRFNTGKTIIRGRSICMTCNRTLRWYELVPILSWVLQSGKCRRCKEVISYQYPIVEFITGLMFVLVTYYFLPILMFQPLNFIILVILYVFIFSILIVISVYDLKHKIIPDKLVIIFSVFSFASLFINQTGFDGLVTIPPLFYLLAGPILAIPFAFIWLVSKGKWMGLGDAKLMLGIGWFLGILIGLSAVVISFWIGAIVSLFILFFSRKRISMKTEIPFAPFLAIGSFIAFIFGLDIVTLSSLFSIF